jgi:WD40 repeat protein
VNLGGTINTAGSDHCALLLPDGHTLIFASSGHPGFGLNDLFISRRHSATDDLGWETPTNLGSNVNSAFADQTPGFFEDESGTGILYFGSNRPGGFGASDVYASLRDVDGSFGPAFSVPELSTASDDSFPTPRRDGLELFLTSNRFGTLGGTDLWVSTRASTSDPWGVPVNMGPGINTTVGDSRGALAFDRTTMVFFSNRPGGFGDNDLYIVTRDKETGKP